MKKLEIIVSSLYVERIVKILESNKTTNFYISEIADAKSPDEERMLFSGLVPAQDKSLITSFINEKKLKELVKELKDKQNELSCQLYLSNIEEI